MYKKIEFYRIVYNFLPLASHDKDKEELKLSFINVILDSVKSGDQHLIKVDQSGNTSVLIEIIDIQNNYLFGIIGKLEDLKGGILKRFRSKEDRSIVDSNEEDINYYIENYTYFYVRFEDLICAVLTNHSAPRFRTHFCNYLKDITDSLLLEGLNVINVFDDNIDYKINRITNLSEVKLIFDDSSIIGNELLDLANTFHLSQSSLREAKINITFKMNAVTDQTKEIFKNSELLKTDFKKLEVIGVDEDEKDVQVELVERILTKKVFIDIDEEYLKSSNDLEKIKEALIKALPPI